MYNNNYFGSGMMPQQNPYNPQLYIQQMQQQRMQPVEQYQPQNPYNKNIGLQGKSVDNIEVVKAMDIPLDGSISYFPIVDGSAIITKQLQQDGTSKTVIYKPVVEDDDKEEVKFVTLDELDEKLKKLSTNDYKDDLKTIKKQIKLLQDDVDEINKDLNR